MPTTKHREAIELIQREIKSLTRQKSVAIDNRDVDEVCNINGKIHCLEMSEMKLVMDQEAAS